MNLAAHMGILPAKGLNNINLKLLIRAEHPSSKVWQMSYKFIVFLYDILL